MGGGRELLVCELTSWALISCFVWVEWRLLHWSILLEDSIGKVHFHLLLPPNESEIAQHGLNSLLLQMGRMVCETWWKNYCRHICKEDFPLLEFDCLCWLPYWIGLGDDLVKAAYEGHCLKR